MSVTRQESKSKVLVLVTTYNCESQVMRVLQQLDDETAPWISEMAVIDNRSSDFTHASVTKALKALEPIASTYDTTLTLLENRENYNLGGSHKAGFAYAAHGDFDHVIVLHGDDQGDLHDILPALNADLHKKYDCVLGGRFMPGSKLGAGYGWFRRFGNYVFLVLFTVFSGKLTWDMGSGLNVYSRRLIDAGDHLFSADNLTFHCYFLLKMYALQRAITFVPITWREEDQVSNAKLFAQSWEILKILLFFRFRKNTFLSSNFGKASENAYLTDVKLQFDPKIDS